MCICCVYMLCVCVVCMCCMYVLCVCAYTYRNPLYNRISVSFEQHYIQALPQGKAKPSLSTIHYPLFPEIVKHGVVLVGYLFSCCAVAVFEDDGFYLTGIFCLCIVNVKALFTRAFELQADKDIR